MEKYKNDIHNVTPNRLAQLLEEAAHRISKIPHNYKDNEETTLEVIFEAARRLRESTKPAFNHKQTEL